MLRSFIRLNQRGLLRLIFNGSSAFIYNLNIFQQLNRYNNPSSNPFPREFSILGAKQEKLRREKPSRSILQGKLERALKERHVDEAWEAYKDFKSFYGFPDKILVSNLIIESSYSSDSKFLRMACELVLSLSKEKPVLLTPHVMTKLILSLARAQIPAPASSILRLMLEKRSLPSLDVLQMVFLHLVKTETGTYLASNILCEICDFFLKLNANNNKSVLTKPDVIIFNLVLDACVRFGSSFKGQLIMELMPQVGVIADAHTVVIISRLHEINGTRDELKKFKDYIDMVPINLIRHYLQFYDSLLSLHFKFNDIDSASALLLDLSNPSRMDRQKEEQKSCSVSIGSDNIKMGLRLQFLPLQLQKDSIYKVENKQEFLVFKNGKLVLSNKGLAKLVLGYKRHGRINGLAKLLISIESLLNSTESNNSSCSDVIDACIHLGWLETAHDILEDLESENYSVREGSYASLLSAYYSEKMFREAEALLGQIRRTGRVMMFSDDEMDFSLFSSKSEDEKISYLKQISSTCKSDLAISIVQNSREKASSLIHEYNSSIYFFTKAKMVEDAQRTYRKMQEMKIQPTGTTFFHMICGYSSLEMYREITILWGDMKRNMDNEKLLCYRDLYESLVINFLRGGYFERVMEVIGLMVENHMYLDKWSYKTEFLKFHRDLYRKLTATDAVNEAQSRRVEHVQAFRKLVGIA